MQSQLSVSDLLTEPPTRVDQILNNAADVLERTCVVEQRLWRLAERLLGPTAYTPPKEDEPPIGSVNRVLYTIDMINRSLDGVFTELERLERL